ncbi:penicillin-insensitive murein endopeptidase [Ensifer soli]|uniref:penicillin-insensitive murein endopeptidase n=1 Tax=Ciceribacter sp. sgz301302 TaxID=3342379 RepID=UPI0035BAEB80
MSGLGLVGRRLGRPAAVLALLSALTATAGAEEEPAKQLFGAVTRPAALATQPIGSYAKGCIAGAVALPADGPTWQAMRLSRNRRWGHPELVSLLERLSADAKRIGWGKGILIGDLSQPRGGPMLTGHASHQIGLDADIWFQPMPDRRLSPEEREDKPFVSMLRKDQFLTVDSRRWTPVHARLVMQAASYPDVERVFVNPAIKKKLCDTWQGDRALLGKVRPVYGHDEHFHIRLHCPEGAANCKPQAKVAAGDGCDKSLAWWFTDEPWAKPKKDPDAKPVKPRQVMLDDLPKACRTVLLSPAVGGGAAPVEVAAERTATALSPAPEPADVPVPTPRPR